MKFYSIGSTIILKYILLLYDPLEVRDIVACHRFTAGIWTLGITFGVILPCYKERKESIDAAQ